MRDFREPPKPSYDYDVNEITEAYKKALDDVQSELQRVDLPDFSRSNAQAVYAQITVILTNLAKKTKEWVARVIPKAAYDGVARTLLALGLAIDRKQALKKAKLNPINHHAVAAAIADTQTDLLAVTDNVTKRVRAAVRKAVAETMRSQMATGVNGRRTITADVLKRIRKTLGDSADNAIIDAAGRKWKIEHYVDVVAQTKLMDVHNEATINEALSREVLYAVVSSHGASDACRYHEGREIPRKDRAGHRGSCDYNRVE
ncbi:minor capsid protein [Brevibacillus laterosporus]|nr:phage minor capsid protein [Brevibacillus laterosporus]TPG73450.1 minor capsid protein [Brevibacillus laterosporus]TPG89573.1 minor capsid protein [Brevibacillus laterosporus]